MEKCRNLFIVAIIFFFLGGNISLAQYSLGGGLSTYHGLNLPIHRYGVNFFFEKPRTPNNTFMLRAAYMLPVKETRETMVSGKMGVFPAMTEATVEAKTSYFAVDGGSRYYLINDYDIGFAIYVGGYLKGIISSYSSKYRLDGGLNIDDYETSDYPPQPLTELKPQYSLLFSFGGAAGIKYQLPYRGALTFDVGMEVVSRLMDPYAILGNDISPISFSLNLAYRFDWY